MVSQIRTAPVHIQSLRGATAPAPQLSVPNISLISYGYKALNLHPSVSQSWLLCNGRKKENSGRETMRNDNKTASVTFSLISLPRLCLALGPGVGHGIGVKKGRASGQKCHFSQNPPIFAKKLSSKTLFFMVWTLLTPPPPSPPTSATDGYQIVLKPFNQSFGTEV